MTKNNKINALIVGSLAPLLHMLIRTLSFTQKVRVIEGRLPELDEENVIFACFHQRMFGGIKVLKKHKLVMMVSDSDDGELGVQVIHRFGFRTVRGSTNKPTALKATLDLMRYLRKGAFAGHMVDGPLGPKGVVKEGVLALAAGTKKKIVPISFGYSRQIEFKSWDRFRIPLFFSGIQVAVGEAIAVQKNASQEQLEKDRQALEISLHRLDNLCDLAVSNDGK